MNRTWLPIALLAAALARVTPAEEPVDVPTVREASPEEIESELDTELAAGDVQLFSSTRGLFSESQRAIRDALDFALGPAAARVEVYVFKRPRDLGIDTEFAVVTFDGKPIDAYVISTAGSGRQTVEGRYRLDFLVVRGKRDGTGKPYPWKRSTKYWQSPMYWGLRIYEGWWIHSTPHYDELGRPASMGCVRLTFPAAMELWDMVVNRADGDGAITIYGSGSPEASATLARLGVTTAWIRERVERDLADARAVTTGEYDGVGHARRNAPLTWPACGDVDCFDYFGRERPRA